MRIQRVLAYYPVQGNAGSNMYFRMIENCPKLSKQWDAFSRAAVLWFKEGVNQREPWQREQGVVH